jgi:uncharacterized protein with PIN domain
MINKRPKFILTVDANKLAKWLRLMGYDAKVVKSISVLNLVRIANKEKRIVLSRSKEILNHPVDFQRVYLNSDNYQKQLTELIELIEFKQNLLFTRCPEDNNELVDIAKKKILHLIPEKVASSYHDFKVCQKCGRIYWKGSHYTEISQKLTEILGNRSIK